jgi:hypothetical protein
MQLSWWGRSTCCFLAAGAHSQVRVAAPALQSANPSHILLQISYTHGMLQKMVAKYMMYLKIASKVANPI